MKKSMPDSQDQALADLRLKEKLFWDSLLDCVFDKTSCELYDKGKCLKDNDSDFCPAGDRRTK